MRKEHMRQGLNAQGVEAQSVECLLSTHQALGSVLKMA